MTSDPVSDVYSKNSRSDAAVEESEALVAALRNEMRHVGASQRRRNTDRTDQRKIVRVALMETPRADPNGLERILGQSDLVSINFLERGRRVADAVCRIRVPGPGDGWYGTGFLVGQRLLLTNNHVLSSRGEASQAEAEFGYEADLDGVLKPAVKFNLAPHEVFYTDLDLDITLVAVSPYSETGVPLERYGRLPLLPVSGKGLHGEWVTIVQHPGGQPKQIAIRANQIIELTRDELPTLDETYAERFIHYSTDTEPGSSGAPVLNDQWQVVAIHHKAIRASAARKTDDGEKWLANEGVRISAICRRLDGLRFTNKDVAAALERLERAIGLTPLAAPSFAPPPSAATEADRKPFAVAKWTQWNAASPLGYDPNFLTVPTTLDDIVGETRDRIAPLKDGSPYLHYLHFSTVIDRDRKFPLLTAVNIHGQALVHPGPRKDPWRRDARIDDEFQPAGNFYEKNKGDDPVQFSRGHLVRRIDPCWGTTAQSQIAEEHTFHYTNSTPQVQKFNDSGWGDLEDYVLDRAQTKERKMSVFTGPIFKPGDPLYGRQRPGGPWRIPVSFWKIAVVQKTENTVAAVGFIIGQVEYIQALYEAKVFTALNPYTLAEIRDRRIQATIATIEEETGLSFGPLKAFDTLSALESTRHVRFVRDPADLIL